MAQRVAAIFPNRAAAERAANALVDLGAMREHVSMLSRGEEGMITTTAAVADDREDRDFVEPAREVGDTGAPMTTAEDEDTAAGAATGATIGAVAGLAAGALALMVPGFGLVLAAGPLAWALGGVAGSAAAGAIAGGIYGSLRDVGIEEPYARSYEERVRSGDVLLTAMVPSIAEERVLDVLAEYGAEDVSFADDTPIAQMPSTAAATMVDRTDYASTDRADRDMATTTPAEARPTDATTAFPSTTTSVGGMATTGTGYNRDIARGEAKQFEGEMRDRAADATANPFDDLAAKGKKLEGKVQEEFGEAKERLDTPSTFGARSQTDTVPSAATPTEYSRTQQDRDTASYAESPIGAASTTGAAFDSNIARGQAKQVEGEVRDRAADRTANPLDDLAAKGKKLEGKVQVEYGEAEETIERRKP